MNYLNYPVYYLEKGDFDSNGNIINPRVPRNKPVLLMIQAGFCGYCTQAKPDFQKFANDYSDKVFVATIQGDGKEKGEIGISDILPNIRKDFRGYPDYVLFVNGQPQPKQIKGRKYKDLVEFVGL